MTHFHMVQIDKDVPFGTGIYCWLRLTSDWNLASLVRDSSPFEHHYLAWETVRNGRNPFFEKGTGFEGYFVGLCFSPEEALDKILETGQNMLTSIGQFHRYEPRFRSTLIKTLTGEASDPRAMAEWTTELGATLARLRCNLIRNPQADAFQTETYRLVNSLPSINYIKSDHTIRQCYTIESISDPGTGHLVVGMSRLKSSEQDAWLVAQSVGKFGHPLVREYMRFSPN